MSILYAYQVVVYKAYVDHMSAAVFSADMPVHVFVFLKTVIPRKFGGIISN